MMLWLEEIRWLRQAIRSLETGGMCTQCLCEVAKGEEHDALCPVGVAIAEADKAAEVREGGATPTNNAHRIALA